MRPNLRLLINTPEIEIWPASLLRARNAVHTRALTNAYRVLRRKRDGRTLVAETTHGWMALVPHWQRESGISAALRALTAPPPSCARRHLPLTGLTRQLAQLGLDADSYTTRTGLRLQPEPAHLTLAGLDRYRRPLWLTASAGRAWRWMRAAAAAAGIMLDAISGYRSHAYQMGIVLRKLRRGLALDEILAVNAAPGFSEHHSGTALDIGTPGEPPAEDSFEHTPAFAWLCAHAARFGFAMSYPRDNPHGIVYEPWHWRWHGR